MALSPDSFIPRHKAFNEIIREIAIRYRYRNSPKHIIQVFQHIETVGLGSLNQAVSIRRSNSAVIGLAEEPILSANYKRADRVFGGVIGDRNATIIQNQREFLCAFLDHGEIEISNNQVENAIRPIVVGRKNWLFCDTQAGAQASTMIFSLLETAKANELNPEAYLNHLLTVLPERFAADPMASLDDLMPWAPEIQKLFKVDG